MRHCGFGMRTLKVLKNHLRELDVFGLPLGLGKHDPMRWTLRAFFEHVCKKWLRVADEADFAAASPSCSHSSRMSR